MHKKNITFIGSALLLGPLPCFAAKDTSLSLGSIAGGLASGASALSIVMLAAAIVAGTALVFTAFTQFNIHRKNPKLVPLMNPIVYLFLGIVLLLIPLLDYIFGFEKTGSPQKAEPKAYYGIVNIDEPLER